MEIIGTKSFFNKFETINENVQAAKDYLLRKGAEKLKKEKRELSPEEQKAILSDPEWIQVRDMVQKNPGYALIFLRFAKEQKAPKDILATVLEQIIKNKDKLKDLPHEIAKYADLKKTKNDQRPGYEVLIDDILILEKKSKLKKLYNALQPKMRSAFEDASEDQIKELTEISNELDGLKPKDGNNPWSVFGKTLGRYENDKGYYPQFDNTTFAFKTMIEEAKDFVDSWKMSDDEYVSKLLELQPQIDVLYSKNKILAISTRTPDAQREVQGVLGWCLKYDSHFWNYVAGDRVQLVIIDGNKNSTDPMRSIGVTVEKDGSIHAAYDAPNQSIKNKSGKSYRTVSDLLKDNGYPESLIKTLERKIPEESRIKSALTLFYKKEENKTPVEIIKSLINLNSGFLKGQISPQDWEKISADVTQIIFEVRGLKRSDFLKEFKKSGIFSEATWEIWDRLIGDAYTAQDIQDIEQKTKTNLGQMQDLIDLYGNQVSKMGIPGLNQETIDIMKRFIQNKDEIISMVQKRMK
jgi:hypothetical protein